MDTQAVLFWVLGCWGSGIHGEVGIPYTPIQVEDSSTWVGESV